MSGAKIEANEFKVTLGKKVRLLRELNQITQMDLARSLGMTSTGAISQVESGQKGMTVENIHRTAMFFNVHPAVLFSSVKMEKDDLRIMQIMMDRIANKKKDAKKAKEYQLISKMILSENS